MADSGDRYYVLYRERTRAGIGRERRARPEQLARAHKRAEQIRAKGGQASVVQVVPK